ncbi:MAG: Spy/CpxP family protein refolding chaperone [Syntrophomonadaceae bacterium]
MTARRLALALAVLLAAGAALAQPALIEGKWWKRPRIAQALALTPSQTADLEKIFAARKPTLIDLKADLEKKQFEYEQAMTAENADRKKVEASVQAREQARARLQTELSLMELDMRQVLTPEQREKAQQLRAEVRERLLQRRRQWRQGGGGDDGAAPPSPRGGGRRNPTATPNP